MLRRNGRRPKVSELVRGHILIETGADQASELRAADRVAVLVHFSVAQRVTRSFSTLVHQFVTAGYRVLVVSSAECRVLSWPDGLPPSVVVLRKPNVGYDFGSWSVGLEFLGAGRRAPWVVLANDSLVGPFASTAPLLESFESSAADVWGLTDTWQFSHHLQSYFLGFRNGALDEVPLREFWCDVRHESAKEEVIHRGEMGLSALLHTEGYVAVSGFRSENFVAIGENPTIAGWDRLLLSGFPFVKRTIVQNPSVAPRGRQVGQLVRALYGEELDEWL